MKGGGVLLISNRASARCHFHKSLNWARLVHTNFRCSVDRTLRRRDRTFDFSQEMVNICAGT